MESLPIEPSDNIKAHLKMIQYCQDKMRTVSRIPRELFNAGTIQQRIEDIKKHEFKFWLFRGYRHNGLFWVRFVTGHGLHIKNSKKHGLIFSERNGFAGFSIVKYHFKLLRPNN